MVKHAVHAGNKSVRSLLTSSDGLQDRAGENLRWHVPTFSTNFEEILSCTQGNFEEQNEVLRSSIIIIINYFNIIVFTDAHYIVKAKNNNYISNKDLLEECDTEENVAVTVGCY